jgi:hypothetical protein
MMIRMSALLLLVTIALMMIGSVVVNASMIQSVEAKAEQRASAAAPLWVITSTSYGRQIRQEMMK